MSAKRWLSAVALVLLVLIGVSASADVSGINVISAVPVSDAPAMYFEVRALDSKGTGLRMQRQDFHFTAGEVGIELTANAVPSGNQGHIIVVDTSLYYYGNKNIKIENIRDIIGTYLSRLSSDERVMFVLASDATHPTCTNYMTLQHAREYADGIVFSQDKSSKINSAIYEAFGYAISPAQEAPLFNTVFIVADPDLENNQDMDHTLNECVQLRASSGHNFDVAVATIRRENFLKDTSDARRKAINQGFSKYRDFASQCGGQYLEIPQDNNGVDTDDIHVHLSQWLYSTQYYSVDFSPLSGHLLTDPQVQSVKISVSCEGAVRTIDVQLDTSLLPEPEVTPTPTVNVPTPTPAPTPVVVVGQTDSMAMQAIYALNQLNYLNKTNVREFDNDCFIAYIDFCRNNGIDPRDGIYEETYHLMLEGEAVAAAVATPQPTATPEPTIPPEGYSINAQDTETSGDYIARMQAILKNLNCYKDEAFSNVGRLDQATVDAVNTYCEAFNWRNDHANGVSKEICLEILTNGSKLNPLEKEKPTFQEKAKAFLAAQTQVLQYAVPNWILIAACFVLVIVIAVICIVFSSDKKKQNDDDPTPQTQEEGNTPASQPGTKPAAQDDESPTVSPFANRTVRMEIRYAGECCFEEITLEDGKPFTIGRRGSGQQENPDLVLDSADKSVSRGRHAVLLYRNDQIYLSDASRYHNTMINGMTVFEHEGRDGVPVNSGDEIMISSHRIQIRW